MFLSTESRRWPLSSFLMTPPPFLLVEVGPLLWHRSREWAVGIFFPHRDFSIRGQRSSLIVPAGRLPFEESLFFLFFVPRFLSFRENRLSPSDLGPERTSPPPTQVFLFLRPRHPPFLFSPPAASSFRTNGRFVVPSCLPSSSFPGTRPLSPPEEDMESFKPAVTFFPPSVVFSPRAATFFFLQLSSFGRKHFLSRLPAVS